MSGDKIIRTSGEVPLVLFLTESKKLCRKLAWRGELLRKALVYLCKLVGFRLQGSFMRHEENPC